MLYRCHLSTTAKSSLGLWYVVPVNECHRAHNFLSPVLNLSCEGEPGDLPAPFGRKYLQLGQVIDIPSCHNHIAARQQLSLTYGMQATHMHIWRQTPLLAMCIAAFPAAAGSIHTQGNLCALRKGMLSLRSRLQKGPLPIGSEG